MVLIGCIPGKPQLGRIKLGWLIQFGETPSYKENAFPLLLPESSFAPKFALHFIEAFNGTSKRK